MSSLTVLLFLILSHQPCHSALTQVFFYGVEWTSSIPNKELAAGDTMIVEDIALIANNEAIDIQPTITGFQNPSVVTDGQHSTSTYPDQPTFSVKWDFNGQLLPIDYIRIFTNCGDQYPSNYCKNTQLIFNNSVSRTTTFTKNVTDNIYTIRIVKYDNECDNNTLLLDRAASPQQICNFECEECLENIDIDLDTYTMNTSSSLDTNLSCQCPTFQLELDTSSNLQIWDANGNDKVGLLQRGGNREFVQLDWEHWMEQEVGCRQMYTPNVDDFMGINAHSGMIEEFIFIYSRAHLFCTVS